jgi:hypothetical protein
VFLSHSAQLLFEALQRAVGYSCRMLQFMLGDIITLKVQSGVCRMDMNVSANRASWSYRHEVVLWPFYALFYRCMQSACSACKIKPKVAVKTNGAQR